MKSLITSFIFFISIITVSSQIFHMESIPVIGDSIAIQRNSDGTVFEPGSFGENQTWDFTKDSYPDDDYFAFKDVSDGNYSDRYQGAVAVALTKDDNEIYYSKLSTTIERAGAIVTIDNENAPFDFLIYNFTSPQVIGETPIMFGDSNSISYSGTFESDNGFINGTFTATGYIKADATGTLVTAAGTFNNVLRLYTHIEEVNSFNQTTVIDQYVYVSHDYRYWLALNERRSLPGDINIDKWYAVNPVSASPASVSIDSDMIDIKIYPNPAQDNIAITTKKIMKGVKVYNSMGRLLFEANDLNSLNYNLDISVFNAGVYNIVTTEENGKLRTTKFIKK